MPNISPADAARIVRQAVTALSERLTGDYGELVPDASAERTAALLQKLEAGGESGSVSWFVCSWVGANGLGKQELPEAVSHELTNPPTHSP